MSTPLTLGFSPNAVARLVREIDQLRRLHGDRGPRLWGKPDGTLHSSEGRVLAQCLDPADAVYFARLHNIFLQVVNLATELRRRLTDHEAMKQEIYGKAR